MNALNNPPDQKIDVVIPYHSKDGDVIDMCIAGCINNVSNVGTIYVVTNDPDRIFTSVRLIDENRLFEDGLSKKYLESRLSAKYPQLVCRSGWLFQQFIKMGCSYAISDLADYYLVVDADVVFLKKINFFESGRMLLTKSEEYHEPYFDCCERLFGKPIDREHAFVAHHMLICKSIMLELLQIIEKRFNMTWYDAIIENIDEENASMFSEYETYGHYLENQYPEMFTIRRLANAQRFKKRYLLKILLNQVDYATIHNYKKPENNPKTNAQIYKLFVGLVERRVRRQKAQIDRALEK